MAKFLILLLVFFSTIALAESHTQNIPEIIAPYNMTTYDQVINDLYSKIPNKKHSNINERIATISRFFLGKPYYGSPLGEGMNAKFDKNPLYRTDQFDCMTFISTVLALAKSNNLKEFKTNINKINYYQAKIAFTYRNHFTNIDWNKNNINNGYLKDITLNIKDKNNQPIAVISKTVINKPKWFAMLPASSIKSFLPISAENTKELLNDLHELGNKTTVTNSIIYYLPLNKLFTKNGKPKQYLFDQIPSGAIIEVIRPNWDLTATIGTKLDVSHMGFAIRTKQGLMFREASSVEKKVVDIPLTNYLATYLTSSTVKGINVQIPITN